MALTSKTPAPGRGGPRAARARRAPEWPRGVDGLTAQNIDFAAVARVLANTCRWGGRTAEFYSVAQHAALASEEVENLAGPGNRRRLALFALLTEVRVAWLGDIYANGPVSTRVEERVRRDGTAIDRAAREAAGLDGEPAAEEAELLRFAERMLEAALRRDFPGAGMPGDAGAAFPPVRRRIRPMPPGRAAKAWLARFRELSPPCPDAAADRGGAAGLDAETPAEPRPSRDGGSASMGGAGDAE